MIKLEQLKPYVWILKLVLAVVLAILCAAAGYNYAHKDTLVVQSELNSMAGLLGERDAAIRDNEQALAKAQKEEVAAKKREESASRILEAFKAKAKKEETSFTNNTVKILKRPECAVLKERLCPSAMGY